MASASSIQILKAWNPQVMNPLQNVLKVTMDVYGKTAPEATKQAIYHMATSAGTDTPPGEKRREVKEIQWASKFGRLKKQKYVDTWQQGATTPKKVFQHQFAEGAKNRLEGTWRDAQKIARVMMARQSWLWSLGKGKGPKGPTELIKLNTSANATDKPTGYILRNKLVYILKIMPSGWKERAEKAAMNRIMAMTAKKLGIAFEGALKT